MRSSTEINLQASGHAVPILGEGSDGSIIGGKVRDVGLLQLVFLAFFMTAGGPFGVEEAVQSAGVGATLLGLALAPFLYVLPQTLMTAELSTMMPENGGYVVWVCRGLGPFWGWMNAWNSALCNVFDNAIYPVLTIEYIRTIYTDEISEKQAMVIKIGVVVIGAVINFFKLRMIGNGSGFLALVVLAPFVICFFYTLPDIKPAEQWFWDAPRGLETDWAAFVSTLLWLHTGWDGLGSVAGEVKDGGRVFIRTVIFTTVLNFFVYVTAVVSAATVSTATMDPDDVWNDAYLSTAYKLILPGFGLWVAITSAIDNMALYFVNISSTSRVIAKMADGGETDEVYQGKISMLPAFFGWEWNLTGSPVIAIVVQSALIIFLVQYDFSFLVEVDAFTNAISLLLEFTAFIRLRYTEPDAPRPYKIPGGMFVAWTITLVKTAFVIAIFVLMAYYEWKPFAATLGMNVFFVLAWIVRTRCIGDGPPRRREGSELFSTPSSDGRYSKLSTPVSGGLLSSG